MNYKISDIPFFLKFDAMPRKVAREFFEWYVEQIPQRIKILEAAVQSSTETKYQTWEATKTPESLDLLGKWYAEQLAVIPIPEAERQARQESIRTTAPEKLRHVIQVPYTEFDQQSFSIIIDVGMYWGETLGHSSQQIRWQLCTWGGKSFIDFHHPIVQGINKRMTASPQKLMHVAALGLVEKTKEPSILRTLYEYWLDILTREAN